MKLRIDTESDALYLRLNESQIIESEEVAPGIILDFNERNEVVGIEMLRVSRRTPPINLKEFQFETA